MIARLICVNDLNARPLLLMAERGSAQMRGFATGVGSKADMGTPTLAQLSFTSPRPSIPNLKFDSSHFRT